jgi:type II secretion system (T2SS) protein E
MRYPSKVSDEETTRRLAAALGWPYVDLEKYAISCGLLRRIPAELACRERCVPMVSNAFRVVLVVDNLFSAAYMAANPQLLGAPYGRRLELALTTPRALDAALRKRASLVRG